MKTTATLFLALAAGYLNAQPSPFFRTEAPFVGALSNDAGKDWTKGWTNYSPGSTAYPAATDMSTLDGSASGKLEISNTLTLDASKVYLLKGLVVIKSGALLIIPAGTVIRAEADVNASPKNYASILVQRGGKIEINGTGNNPVVITSNKAAGARNRGDWGGIIICGSAVNNQGNDVQVEGFNNVAFDNTLAMHGGTNNEDNSGKISYCRLEFGGLAFESNKEINGLTLGSVGRRTDLEGIQVSYSGDDGFEWFGGNVNASRLISWHNTDDDFDTDFGYSGAVQFGIAARDTAMYDLTYNAPSGASTSESFESDNDAGGSGKTPYTSAVFSNITCIGPVQMGKNWADLGPVSRAAFRRAVRIRKNSRLSIVNSIFMGYRNFLMLDGDSSLIAFGANNNSFPTSPLFRNNLIVNSTAAFSPASATANGLVEVTSAAALSGLNTWVKAGSNANNIDPVAYSAGTVLVDPQGTNPDFRPVTGSPALNGADFSASIFNQYLSAVSKLQQVQHLHMYPNPATSVLHISWESNGSETVQCHISDLQGRLVLPVGKIETHDGKGQITVDLNSLENGVYMVCLAAGNATSARTIIINK